MQAAIQSDGIHGIDRNDLAGAELDKNAIIGHVQDRGTDDMVVITAEFYRNSHAHSVGPTTFPLLLISDIGYPPPNQIAHSVIVSLNCHRAMLAL